MPHEYVLLTPRVIGLREVAHAVAATEPTLTYRMDAGGMQIVLLDGDATVLTIVHPVPARQVEVRRLLGDDAPAAVERWWIDLVAPWESEQRAARVIAALAAVSGGVAHDLAPDGRG
ncbi:MAG: hypothetical protein IJO71_05020 [Microbacterium sp.]|jgi:hypothetical protein|uniref:hypothetical protein n=1 Tax=Microbacterium sp. TaxID=51671 RepID=UPI0026004019|nr:hypothetical protein [Microbacterium sp.]MBQ9916549.1 hypothetical protein [Microbacterium sp.]